MAINLSTFDVRDVSALTDNEIKAILAKLITSHQRADLLSAVMAEEETRNTDSLLSFGDDLEEELV